VRGEIRMLSLSINSLAMRSCPQVGFSAAIPRMSRRGLWAGEVCRAAVISSATGGGIPGGASGGRYRAGHSPGRPATRTCGPKSPSSVAWNHGLGVASPSALETARAVFANRGSRPPVGGETARRV
jgi:hypothetical protein